VFAEQSCTPLSGRHNTLHYGSCVLFVKRHGKPNECVSVVWDLAVTSLLQKVRGQDYWMSRHGNIFDWFSLARNAAGYKGPLFLTNEDRWTQNFAQLY